MTALSVSKLKEGSLFDTWDIYLGGSSRHTEVCGSNGELELGAEVGRLRFGCPLSVSKEPGTPCNLGMILEERYLGCTGTQTGQSQQIIENFVWRRCSFETLVLESERFDSQVPVQEEPQDCP